MDFRAPHHLPKRGEGRPTPERLPRQRRGTTPQMHGRYPDYDVLAELRHWDEATRRVVLERVAHPPDYRFFDRDEQATLEAFCDTVTAQDAEPRIPVLRYVDRRLANGELDGYQHVELPDDRELWHLAARGLDQAAAARGAERFAAADAETREAICGDFQSGRLEGGVWDEVDAELTWGVLLRYALAAFYAHPWAWNEIGFGGPAYPRGYSRLGPGQREQWEGVEAFSRDPAQ